MNQFLLKFRKIKSKYFKEVLDISLLKPVNEWDNNDYYEIDKFSGIIEGFD